MTADVAFYDMPRGLSVPVLPSAGLTWRLTGEEASVPVTARLSRVFYERLGEQVTNELVDWFNVVDRATHAELRELNELNLARFEAKLNQRLAELEGQFDKRFADQRVELRELKAEMIKWIFLFWAGSAFAGLLMR